MLEILAVESGSIAEELGIKPGDRLLKVNGEPVLHLVDYLVEETSEILDLELERKDGTLWELGIEHDSDDPLGLVLPHPEPVQCGNNCIFCFVHQLPRGMRRSLYIKDEDYRFSYLYGAYITLTNLREVDFQRIIRQHLSPLYISVHATENALRCRLLGKQVAAILPQMQRLVDGAIDLHTQVVVCPGLNDGEQLAQTCADLVALAPGVRSLAVVPVGLTGHRQRLPQLRIHTREEAATLVDWIEAQQVELLQRLATRFIFAADELYLKAGREFPALEAYEELAQIENGVGLIALFRAHAAEVLAVAAPIALPPMSLVTGVSASHDLQAFASALNQRCGLDLRVHVIENRFFGGQVTVTGLLTGQDLAEQLSGAPLGKVLLVPDVMLREGERTFLDDMSVSDLAERLDVEVEVVPTDPWGIWDMLDTLAMESDLQ